MSKLGVLGMTLLLALASCAKTDYIFTKTGEAGPAKPPNCDFVIATTKVDHPYQEIGILDSQQAPPQDAAAFKAKVQPQVCAVGGDAVVTEVNGTGYYVRGTILRFTEQK